MCVVILVSVAVNVVYIKCHTGCYTNACMHTRAQFHPWTAFFIFAWWQQKKGLVDLQRPFYSSNSQILGFSNKYKGKICSYDGL